MVLVLLPIHLGEPRLKGHETVVYRDPTLYEGRHKLKIAFLEAIMAASGLPIVDTIPKGCMFYDPLDCDTLDRFRARSKEDPMELKRMFVLRESHLNHLWSKNKGKKQVQHRVFFSYAKKTFGIFENIPSQDMLNRKRLPRDHVGAVRPKNRDLLGIKQKVIAYVNKEFVKNPGSCEELMNLPITRKAALTHMKHFMDHHLAHFGPYEDAMHTTDVFVHHMHCSFLLNVGLLYPKDVLDVVKARTDVPLNSREGLVRQVLGWREYMRYIYHFHGAQLQRGLFTGKGTYLDYKNPLPSFKGILPLEIEMKKIEQWAWSHHIVRLMVFLNFFHRRKVKLVDMYNFFMRFIALDAYSWVMVSNLAAMGRFTVKGVPYFMRKRYVTDAAYLLQMSNYPRGKWCEEW